MHWQFGEMEFGELKRNTSNWSNFCMLLRRAGLTASAGLSWSNYFLGTFVYPGTVHVYWGHIWWWLWFLQLLEAAGHHFFESCSDAARQLPEKCINICWMSGIMWRHMWWMPSSSSKLIQHCQVPSSAAVERLSSAAGQILSGRRCKLSEKHSDMSVFLRDCLKSVQCESCTAGPATFLKNNLMFASLRGF